jgi:outer membrane protein assembly factor BamB
MRRVAIALACAVLGTPVFGATAEDRAAEVVKLSGVRAGLAVHVGVTDGALTAALGKGGKFLVHGLAADAASAAKARAHIQSLGLYGRVSVQLSTFKTLPYADNTVNLIVAEADVAKAEAMRVLCPGGVLLVQKDGEWVKTVKPRPKAMDDWTHHRHGADGNKVSGDRLVGPPAGLRWRCEPTWSRRHAMNMVRAMVSAGGRLFYVCDEAPKNVAVPARLALIARDTYNGCLLWKRPVGSDFRKYRTRALVASGDRLFAVLKPGGPLVALDPATGRTIVEYKDAPHPTQAVFISGVLLISGAGQLVALDVAGKLKWSHKENAANVMAADGKVFYQLSRTTVVSRDLATGKELWRASTATWSGKIRPVLCFYNGGRLFLGGGFYAKPHAVFAISAKDGKHLWTRQGVWGGTDIYVASGLLWLKTTKEEGLKNGAALGLDPATGEVKKRFAFPAYYPSGRGHARCYPNTATERFLLLASRGTDFVELATGKVSDMRAFCGDCGFGVVPANGLIYMAPNSCTCYTYYGGIRALAPTPAGQADTSPRLNKGLAYNTPRSSELETPNASDWPTHRHDARRTGITPGAVPAKLEALWAVDVGGTPSAPTVANGAAYVASLDDHSVRALDAATGKTRWTFVAGGPVDSPPTIYEGMCLFGSRDGYVYCLRASDGALIWRFRAAQADRRIVVDGRLESAWPVHGAVLVKDGSVCFASGRAPQLDGGVTMTALEARTGKLIWSNKFGALADVVAASRGSLVYMGRYQCDLKTGGGFRRANRPLVAPGSGFLDGSYAARRRWYNGTTSAELMVSRMDKGYPMTIGFAAFAHANKNAMSAPGKQECKLFRVETRGAKAVWSAVVPVRVRAMVLAEGGEGVVFAAGPPDTAPPQNPWAAFDGKLGAELWALSAKDGTKLSTLKLDAAPVFDGMAAAGGKLYLSTVDGKLRCFGKK